MDRKVILTGFTGVIGKRIAYGLARRGTTVLLPIRAAHDSQLQERFDAALQVLRDVEESFDDAAATRLIPFIGDLRKPAFGLSDDTVSALGLNEATAVWHLAAALDLTETNSKDVFETNVGGTRHLLEFMKVHGIRDMHYFSTFAVHGRRHDGVAEEKLLEKPSPFRNSYEQTKWEGEHMVWQARAAGHIHAAIYRPSIVVGDSRTGRYEQFNAFNHAFDVASRLRIRLAEKESHDLEAGALRFPLRIPGMEQATLNIVPLDYVVTTSLRIYESGDWDGKIFHLTNPNPPRLKQMMEIFQRSEPWEGLSWSHAVGPEDFAHGYEKFAYKQYGFLIPYLMGEATFDQSSVKTVLNGNHPNVCNETFLTAITRRARSRGWQEI